MKSKLFLWFGLLLVIGAYYDVQGQAIAKPWEIGVAGGMNWQRIKEKSGSSHWDSWWIVPESRTSYSTKTSGNNKGFQGSAIVSFHPRKHFSLQSGVTISSVEAHAVRSETTTYIYYDDVNYSSTHTSVYEFDKEYVLMDIPLVFRWYINSGEQLDIPTRLYLDFGTVFRFPLADNSELQVWNDGKLASADNIDIDNRYYYLGIGVQVKQYALGLNWTGLATDNSEYNSSLMSLSLVRYFSIGK